MGIRYSKELLVIFIANVARILNAGFGVNHAESALFQVVNLLREESDLKEPFLDLVKLTLNANDPGKCDEGMVPIELIELVTHELKWPEFEQIANDRIKNRFNSDRSFAAGDVSIKIHEAYSEDWEDREFYAHYQC